MNQMSLMNNISRNRTDHENQVEGGGGLIRTQPKEEARGRIKGSKMSASLPSFSTNRRQRLTWFSLLDH